MRSRMFAVFAIACMLFAVVSFASGDTRRAKAKNQETTRLVSLLPASDGVAVFDAKRFLDEGLPRLLSANQPILSEINAHINAMQDRTGIDLRKFDQVAAGVAFKQVSPTETDYEPVVIAGGDIDAGALIAAARLVSKNNYREEKIGDRTVYIFTPKDVVNTVPASPSNPKVAAAVDHITKALTKEIAVTTIDPNTIALGTLSRIRETLEASSHVGTDLTSLLSIKETAVMSFASKVPGGMTKLLPLDDDELGANIDSIRFLTGSLDIAVGGTSVQLMARTAKPEQAAGLRETLDGLKFVGTAFLGGSKRADQKIYARMIKNVKITARGTDVSIDLLIPQSDIDTLVAGIKLGP